MYVECKRREADVYQEVEPSQYEEIPPTTDYSPLSGAQRVAAETQTENGGNAFELQLHPNDDK